MILPAALVLDAIERKIGVAHQFFDGASVARTERGPDAGPDIQDMMIDLIGFGQMFDDRTRDLFDIGAVPGVADHDGEFVTAQSAAHFVFAHQGIQALGDFRQHPVPDQVAERIVDRLEPVQIDHQKRAARAPFLGIPQRRPQAFVEHQAVRKCRERVVAREIGDLGRGFLLFRHVGSYAAEARIAPIRCSDRRARQFPPTPFARNRDFDHEIGKTFAPLQLVGKDVEAGRKISRFPGFASNQLNEGYALDLAELARESEGEARRHRSQPPRGIELEEPIRVGIFIFAQQEGYDLALLVHTGLSDLGTHRNPGRLD